MKILVTAGNTQSPIDQVRCITNIFSGRTGARIAVHAHDRGHEVTLLTSHPEVLRDMPSARSTVLPREQVATYTTYHQLAAALEDRIRNQPWDAIIHAAAVSDYEVTGSFAPAESTTMDREALTWHDAQADPRFVPADAGKISSSHRELWLRLEPTVKLVDQFRTPWGFSGLLLKFKLEVGVTEEELAQRAEQARKQSHADILVANSLEGMQDWALICAEEGWERVTRVSLAPLLLERLEKRQRGGPEMA